ncbi:MAG: molybdopterin-binding protein [Deinococcota bacterium]
MIRTAIVALHHADGHENAALQAVRAVLSQGDFTEVDYLEVDSTMSVIRARLKMLADTDVAELILTIGGIGLDPKDRVTEATQEMIERPVPGLAELIRLTLMKKSRRAALYRNLAGVRRQSIIINLPAEAEAAKLACEAVIKLVPQVVKSIALEPLS